MRVFFFSFKVLQVEVLGFFAINFPLPTDISALQTELSADNSWDGIFPPWEWHSNAVVTVGKQRWFWKFINTFSEIDKINSEINEMTGNDEV